MLLLNKFDEEPIFLTMCSGVFRRKKKFNADVKNKQQNMRKIKYTTVCWLYYGVF